MSSLYLFLINSIYNSVLTHTYYRSTSPPGGNQVDCLPPALRWTDFWIIYWAVQVLYTCFPHRIRLDDSFGQNIINFHKIWAEYGAVKGFGSWTFFWGPRRGEKSWFPRNVLKKLWPRKRSETLTWTSGKHWTFASEALIWLVER